MRKLLPLFLPFVVICVLAASLFLLNSYHQQAKVLGMRIQSATAASPTIIPKRSFTSPLSSREVTASPKRIPPPTLTRTPTPTKKPLPTATDTPSPKLTSQPQSLTNVNLTSQERTMIESINSYRSSLGLSLVKPDKNTCDFAQTRAHELTSGFSHDGFTNRINAHTLPYPNYTEVTENIAQTQDPTQVVTMWINSPGHAENMRRDTPFVCVKGENGNYAYEGWKE